MEKVLEVYNLEGKVVEKIPVDSSLFDGKVNESLLWEAVKMYQANMRSGTASTKTRGMVRGGGRKPYAQKGTGRARHGSIRSPIWKGGGVVFGPQRRNYHYSIPRKKKVLALLSSLNARLEEENLKLLEELKVSLPKTKEFVKIIHNLNLEGKVLFIDNSFSQEVILSSRNIPKVGLCRVGELNAYTVLLYEKIILTKDSFRELSERIKKALKKKQRQK